MLFRPYSRPFDPTAASIQNLILNEERPLAVLDKYLFVPSHGPFYVESLVVRNGRDVLVQGVHYSVLVLHTEATLATAREVAVCIRIDDRSLDQVYIDYQAVGGQYTSLVNVLRQLKENSGGKLVSPIYFKDIIGKPDTFNPSAHYHSMWEFHGWEILINALDRVRQALLKRDIPKYAELYQYWEVKQAEVEVHFKTRFGDLDRRVADYAQSQRHPVGLVIQSLTAINQFKEGVWQELANNTLLYGVSNDSDLGPRPFKLSSQIVYPQSDNILLDESRVPITLDKDEWIFLDNEHPATAATFDDDYGEEIDELFNLLGIKQYVKVSHDAVPTFALGKDKNSVNEGEVVLFTINTTSVAQGTALPYQLTGVGTSNVNVPLTGTIAVNQYGVATLAVKLVEGSPMTGLSTMTFSSTVGGGLQTSVNYTLQSNRTSEAKLRLVENMNNVVLDSVNYGDKFYLQLIHAGMAGTDAVITCNMPAGVNIKVDGVAMPNTGDHALTIRIPSGTSQTYLLVETSYNPDVARVDAGQFSIRAHDGKVYQTASTVFKPLTMDVWIETTATSDRVDSVHYGQTFKLVVKHDARQGSRSKTEIVPNLIATTLTPNPIGDVYTDWSGIGRTTMLECIAPANPVVGTLTIRVYDPYTNTRYRELNINVVT